jgi:uncharacterized membrane protein YkvA (DUF1232 family)
MKNSVVQALYNWYRNTMRHPKYRWWIIIGSLVYLLSPLDISPDVFPVVGWVDDGVIATLLVAELSQLLMERLKGGKGDKAADETTTADSSFGTSADTVDVDAVTTK